MRNDGEHGEGLGRWRASLTAAALVGAERRSVPAPPPALGAAEPNGRDAAERLLEHAALLDVAVRAGTEPMRLSQEHGLPPAPAERLPEAGAAAAAVLERLLERTMDLPAEIHEELLGEWCLLASARGVRIPARLLPRAVEARRTENGGQGLLELVWGERGAWLGEMQRIGAALALPRAETEGAPAPADPRAAAEIERIEAAWPRLRGSGAAAGLRRLRALDPDRARWFLERQWDALGAKARARLLPELGEGLSGADEPLLEGALDDPRQEVRRAAIGLLQRLPGSRFARRMAERLRPLVEVREHGDRLRVGAPDVLDDPAERRDGFERQTPAGRQGPAARLGHIAASVPLQTWRELTGMDPERTAQALRGDRTLLPAISKAAVLQRDRRWAAALVRVSEDPDLVEALDDRERRTVLHARPKASLQRLGDLGRAAVRSGRPWPAEFALDVLERLIAQPRSADSWHARSLLAQLHALLPEDAVDAATGLAAAPAAAEHPLRPLLLRPGRIRTARRTLQEAFS